MYEIRKLLRYGLSPVSFYLARDKKIRKTAKHEIANVVEEKLDAPPIYYVPVYDVKMTIFFDFIAYARKIGSRKFQIFADFATVLWKTISFLSKDAQPIDIVLDLHYGKLSVFCQKTRNLQTLFLIYIMEDNQFSVKRRTTYRHCS